MTISRIFLSILSLTIGCSACWAQLGKYEYKQEINEITSEWHTLELPLGVYSSCKSNLSDIRIMGITSSNDTIEAPYFLKMDVAQTSTTEKSLTILNQSRKDNKEYVTYKVDEVVPLNSLTLNYQGNNFDWKATLEGSNDNKTWFTIIEDYRILSIYSYNANYTYTTITFPKSEYSYYRTSVAKPADPALSSATIKMTNHDAGQLQVRKQSAIRSSTTKDNKTTLIIELEDKAPISQLRLNTKNQTDFIRPIIIRVVTDSFETQKGWKYAHDEIYRGTYSSFESSPIEVDRIWAKTIEITVDHQDNIPFDIDEVSALGYRQRLVFRVPKKANYALVYGQEQARRPNYDITLFKDKLPNDLKFVSLGEIEHKSTPIQEKPRDYTMWLYVVMGIIILLIGTYTIKMMKEA